MVITKAYPKSVRNVPLFDGKYDITEERVLHVSSLIYKRCYPFHSLLRGINKKDKNR